MVVLLFVNRAVGQSFERVKIEVAADISVIVPVYQAQEFLPLCLDSLLHQTHPLFELILVDDGSTDASGRICAEYAARDPRIRVIQQKNQGVSAARNAGMEAARGDFLAFVDSDDWVEPDFLQQLYEAIGNSQLSLCGVADQAPFAPPAECVSRQQMQHQPSRYAQLVYTNYAINKLYRRELLLPAGPRFDPAMKRGEDAAFVAACLQKCDTISACAGILYHYRVNEASATHRFYEGICRDEAKLWEAQRSLFAPAQMSAEEKIWFDRWSYGKIISVLRYIAVYAPTPDVRSRYIADFLQDPERFERFTHLPPGIGGRSRLYAMLARRKWFGTLGFWLGRLG